MRLSLRTKLIGGFVIILLLMVVVGLVGVYTSRHIQSHLEDTVEQDVKAANILGVVARRVGFIHSNSLLHLFTRSVEDMNRYESEVADWVGKISTDLDALENTFSDQATLDKLAEFRTAWETYLRIWNKQVVPLSRANRDEEAFALVRKGGAAGMAAQEAMYKLDELHDTIIAAANDSLKLSEQVFRKNQYILLAVILLAIILGLAFGIRRGSLIAGPVNAVSKAAQLVAAGDLDQSVTVKTGDEIESMADSFNTMTSNMKKMVEELRHEITERQRAEEALHESEQWLSTTLRSIGDAVIATDPKGLVTLMNPVAEDLTGWDEAEAVGKPLEDVFNIINEQTGERAENPVNRVLREGVIVGLANHTVLIAKDGTKRPIADSGAPMRDDEGNIIGTVMVFRDITESKRAEEKLRLFSHSADSSIDGVAMSNLEGRLTYVNGTFCRMFSYSREELIGKEIPFIHPEDRMPELEEALKATFEGGWTGELVGKRKDGELFPVMVSTSRVLDDEGKVIAVMASHKDITERKQAEEEIASLAKFPGENLNPVLRVAKDGTILYANEASQPLLNVWRCQVNQPLPDDWRKFTLDVVDSGSGKDAEVEYDDRILSLAFAPVVGKDYVNVYGLDITERKEMQQQLVRKEKLAVLGQLSGGVGHELRNPLGVISNAVYFLQTTLPDANETTSEYLGIISSEVRTAEKIVSDLLDFSRIKSIEREEIAISDLIDQALEKQPQPKKVEVNTEIPSELPPVFVDSRQIVQVLVNLVVNGYQAMPEGGKLTISAKTKKGKVQLSVVDTGSGISRENLKKIFEPLFTTRARGIGLGLAVSKNLVEANGGSLGVESEEGKGTTFTVTLPTKEEGN